MALSINDYKNLILKLLPQGKAWVGENFRSLVSSFGNECARADTVIESLLTESNPATADVCLIDWERTAGIPDDVYPLAGTNSARQANLVAKLSATGGQTAAYLEAMAAKIGFTITITDGTRPFVAGSHAGDRLYGVPWIYVFYVNVTAVPEGSTVVYDATLPILRQHYNLQIENLINRLKPAHTVALFTYPGG